MIVFRDFLRAHPQEALRYEELKMKLAERHASADDYADAKTSYIHTILRAADASEA